MTVPVIREMTRAPEISSAIKRRDFAWERSSDSMVTSDDGLGSKKTDRHPGKK